MNDTIELKPKRKSPFRRFLLALFLVVVLVLAYLFLLLGEPDEDQKFVADQEIEHITSMMNPMEVTDTAGLSTLADTFRQPVFYLFSGAELQRARMNDVLFGSEYARMVTLTYQLEDGSTAVLKSIRPKEAAVLLSAQNADLDGSKLYTIAGMSAVCMRTSLENVFLAQGENTVYALTVPASYQNITSLLHQTSLLSPSTITSK